MRFPWNRKEADLQRELEYHLHELTAEYERAGHSHRDALAMAKREFGGAEQVKERCRDERRFAWATGIRQDLTFALRQFRRPPALWLPPSLFSRLALPRTLLFSVSCSP